MPASYHLSRWHFGLDNVLASIGNPSILTCPVASMQNSTILLELCAVGLYVMLATVVCDLICDAVLSRDIDCGSRSWELYRGGG